MNKYDSDDKTSNIITLGLLVFVATVSSLSADYVIDELEVLIESSLAHSPRIRAARHRMRQALARHNALYGFYDSELTGRVSRADRSRTLPGMAAFPHTADNTALAGVAFTKAVRPGAYVSLGMTERLLNDPGTNDAQLFQSVIGAQIRIPLLRDRGFRQWALEERRAMAEYQAAASEYTQEVQWMRHAVEQAYIEAQETLAAHAVAQAATARFQSVLEDAEELARLEVIPQYQVFPARMELGLRREEEEAAQGRHEVSLVRLRELINSEDTPGITGGTRLLVGWARRMRLKHDFSMDTVLAARGDYRQIEHRITAARSTLRKVHDSMQSDIALNIAGTWQGEDPSSPIGGGYAASEHHAGSEVALVWTKPLGLTAERHRIREIEENIAEHRQQLLEVELQAEAALQTAVVDFAKAKKRLEIVTDAVDAARKTLDAERERFRAGEGRSRYVLDAQKDLTGVIQRQTRIAAELLRAGSDFFFAAGYAFETGKAVESQGSRQ